jgi:hypothetical protein
MEFFARLVFVDIYESVSHVHSDIMKTSIFTAAIWALIFDLISPQFGRERPLTRGICLVPKVVFNCFCDMSVDLSV